MAEKQPPPGPAADCPVCWNAFNNTFRTPKRLHCQHAFCLECLAHLSLVSPVRGRLQCPLCRQPTLLPADQAVTALPNDEAVLRWLRLEPSQIVLEGRQLCLREERPSRYCLRQPRVYTLDLGPEPGGGGGEGRRDATPAAAAATTALPSRSPLRECARNPQLRIFTYLMGLILSVTLLLVFSVFWTKQFLGGVG